MPGRIESMVSRRASHALGLLARQLVDCGLLTERDWTPEGLPHTVRGAFNRMIDDAGCRNLKQLNLDLYFGDISRIFANPEEPGIATISPEAWHGTNFSKGALAEADWEHAPEMFGGIALWHCEGIAEMGATPGQLYIEGSVRALGRAIERGRQRDVPGAWKASPKLGYEVAAVVNLISDNFLRVGTADMCRGFLQYGMFHEMPEHDYEDDAGERSLDSGLDWMDMGDFHLHLPPSLFRLDPDRKALGRGLDYFTRPGARKKMLPSGKSAVEVLEAAIAAYDYALSLNEVKGLDSEYYKYSYCGNGEETVWPLCIRWNPADWIARVTDFYHQNSNCSSGLTECVYLRGWHLQAAQAYGTKHKNSVASVVRSLQQYLPLVSRFDHLLDALDDEPELPTPDGSLYEDRAHARAVAQRRAEAAGATAQEPARQAAASEKNRVRV